MLIQVDDTFAEAFPMCGTRLILTAAVRELVDAAAAEFCGHASSVIGCSAEAAVERNLSPGETPDGRPGVSVLAFAFNRAKLQKAVVARVGQNVLTCPTTACFAGELPEQDVRPEAPIDVGNQLRYFGDGFQNSRTIGERRLWRIPVMDGEFLVEDRFPICSGVGGGNLIFAGDSPEAAVRAALAAVRAIRNCRDVILPFPAGIVRSGSKVGARYDGLPASTNDAWCPTLRAQTKTSLLPSDRTVYEIVIDGLSESAVAASMTEGCRSLLDAEGITRISAGNYGGKLGPFHFRLADMVSELPHQDRFTLRCSE